MGRLFRTALTATALLVGPAAAGTSAPSEIRVERDKVAMLELAAPASSIHVANPAIADVAVASARRLFVLGRSPGQTNLFVLDDADQPILAATVLVEPPDRHAITLHRGIETFVYSCNPRCVLTEAAAPAAAGGSGDAGATAAGAAGAAGDADAPLDTSAVDPDTAADVAADLVRRTLSGETGDGEE